MTTVCRLQMANFAVPWVDPHLDRIILTRSYHLPAAPASKVWALLLLMVQGCRLWDPAGCPEALLVALLSGVQGVLLRLTWVALPRTIWVAPHQAILCTSRHSLLKIDPSVGLVVPLLDRSHQDSLALVDLEAYLPDQVYLQVPVCLLAQDYLRDRPLSQAWEFTSRLLLAL